MTRNDLNSVRDSSRLFDGSGASGRYRGKWALRGSTSLALLAMTGMAGSLISASSAAAQSLPTDGVIVSGNATINANGPTMTINQTSKNTAINWESFNIAQGHTVQFVQPNSNSVALNRVIGQDPSAVLGNLTANGQVFLINPNGVLFGQAAQVNVAGLVATTLNMTDADFAAGRYRFAGNGGAVVNQGTINADGGYVAMLGASVSNQGLIQANMGTVALAAGTAITLDVAGDGLLNVAVDQGAVKALVTNGGLLRADGGTVLMTAQGAGELLKSAVNNSGVIEARSLESRDGKILLLADMQNGTLNMSGVLDASAPNGGNGGFIETSAATVNIANSARITTTAPSGTTGTWLIDPADFTIAAIGGNITGATLSAQLVTNNVVISTMPVDGVMTPGNGDIHVNDAIAWTASGDATTLTLNAFRDLNINAAITGTNGNIVACCGRDINVDAALTTTNGSIILNAGQNVNVRHAITTTDGNIVLCAGHDIHIDAAVTLTRGSTIPAQSLGSPVGLTLIAGADGTGPGVGGGTIIFASLAPPVTVTVAPVTIAYNPVSYSAPTDFSTKFVLTEGAALTQRMLVFPNGDRVDDGTDNAVLSGFNSTTESGLPEGVTLIAGPDATATFDSGAVGTDIGITYSGYTLGGPNADQYMLAAACCTAGFRTRGTISAAPTPTPAPTPAPTPTPTPPPISPIVALAPAIAFTPTLVGLPNGVELAILDTGVRMPVVEVPTPPAPLEEVAPTFLPPAKPPVPVYPVKQSRH